MDCTGTAARVPIAQVLRSIYSAVYDFMAIRYLERYKLIIAARVYHIMWQKCDETSHQFICEQSATFGMYRDFRFFKWIYKDSSVALVQRQILAWI